MTILPISTKLVHFLEIGKGPRAINPPSNPDELGIVPPADEGGDPVLVNPKLDPLLKKGYSEKDLEQFFDLETGELKPEYAGYEDKGNEPVIVGYKNGKPVYKDVKSHLVFTRTDEKGGSTVELYVDMDGKTGIRDNGMQRLKDVGKTGTTESSIFEDTRRIIHTAANLKKQGITDDMLDKYYDKTVMINGEEGYVLKDGYSIEDLGAGKDSQNGKDYTHRFRITKEHDMGVGKDGKPLKSYSYDYEYVYTDGTTALRRNDGLTSEESKAYLQKEKNEMLAKGYTEEMLEQYFEIVSDTRGHAGYHLKSEYSDVKDLGAGQDIYGKYTHKFIFSSADKDGGYTEVKIMEDGTVKTATFAPSVKNSNPGSPRDPKPTPTEPPQLSEKPTLSDIFAKIKELIEKLLGKS